VPGTGSSNGLAVAALVVGIIAVVTSFCVIGALAGIIAVVLGVLGLQRARREPGEPQKGLAIAGIVTGAVAVVVAALAVSFFVFAGGVEVDSDFGNPTGINTDPADGECDFDRFMQDPDC
jgi:hypothetical protein